MAYATTDEADTYFASRLNTDAWDDASSANQTKALAHATTIIDRLNFIGDKNDEDQANQFPRGDDSTVPDDIKYACCEIAIALLDGIDPDLEYENLTMVSQGYANVRSTYDRETPPEHIIAGVPTISAWRFLRPFLRDPLSVDLHRVS